MVTASFCFFRASFSSLTLLNFSMLAKKSSPLFRVMNNLAFLLSPLLPWTEMVLVLISRNVAYWFLHTSNVISQWYLPYEVLCSDNWDGDSVAESVELNGLVLLKVLLTKEHVEVGVLLSGHIDLVGLGVWVWCVLLFLCHFCLYY